MADSDPNELVFTGSSPEECEAFVSTIRKRALAEKKHHDDDWIAYLASSCFVGEPLYWYEDLDKETQEDWSRLRPALLARFGRRPAVRSQRLSTSTSFTPPALVPTPAAAPPVQITTPSARQGRLKLLDLSGKFRGYIANQVTDSRYYNLTKALEQALSVSLPSPQVTGPSPQVTGIFEISLVVSSQVSTTNDALAITWFNLQGTEWMREPQYFADFCAWSQTTSQKNWATERDVWKISEDLALSLQYPKPDGNFEPLLPYIYSDTMIRWQKSAWSPGRSYKQARLIFEETV